MCKIRWAYKFNNNSATTDVFILSNHLKQEKKLPYQVKVLVGTVGSSQKYDGSGIGTRFNEKKIKELMI
jgi:hypothetical protein